MSAYMSMQQQFRVQLDKHVDQVAVESKHLYRDELAPRFVHAVLTMVDMQASCIRQLPSNDM